ncbi:MAG: tetratricopeptide repeat protein [Thermoguttaceae bacterium]
MLFLALFQAIGAQRTTAAVPPAAAWNRERADSDLLIVEDRPGILVPKEPRSESQREHLEALALFSAARLHEEREDYPTALRLYQRAFRLDERATSIARAIVPLAAKLGRHAVALRYALAMAELDNNDPDLLKRLAIYLSETGQWGRAAELYERLLSARSGSKENAADILMRLELGRLYLLTERYDKAADHLGRVLAALDHPAEFGIDEAARKSLLGEDSPTSRPDRRAGEDLRKIEPGMKGSKEQAAKEQVEGHGTKFAESPGRRAADTYSLMGEAFLLAGQTERARALFEKSHRLAPDEGLWAYNLARVEFRSGRPKEALQSLQTAFDKRLSTEGLGPYRLLADALAALHQEKELIPRLEKLRAAEPGNVPLGYFLAEKYFASGQFDKAEPLYRALAAVSPAIAGYRNLIEIHRRAKRYGALLDVFAEAVEKTASLEPLGDKNRALAEDKEMVQSLIKTAEKRFQTAPASFSYRERLAVALLAFDAGKLDAADRFFALAIQSGPDHTGDLLLTWGLGLLAKGEYARAAAVLRRGIEIRTPVDKRHVFYFYLAGALEMAGRTDEALTAARKAADLADARDAAFAPRGDGPEAKDAAARREGPQFCGRVAWVLYHAKRLDEAAKTYAGLIAKFDNDYDSGEIRQTLREARLALSDIAAGRHDIPLSVECLEQVLDEFPGDAAASNDLGYLWADQGKNLLRAHRMIQRAVAEEPENAAYRDSLGWVFYRLGRIPEAIAELEKATAKESDPTVLEHLGEAYRKSGQAKKADDAFHRAAEARRKAGEIPSPKSQIPNP